MKILKDSPPLVELGAHGVGALDVNADRLKPQSDCCPTVESFEGNRWIAIGWTRISELVQTVHIDAGWSEQQIDWVDDEDDLTVADLAAPYCESQAGPTWWCHVAAGHTRVDAWLYSAQWLHPAISIALRDESRLISDRMKHLLYEGSWGPIVELLGQSAGDPYVGEDDIPIVLRSWQTHNFLMTALHGKGSATRINVLGITEVQELLLAGGYNAPKTAHEVIAHLASPLARWDDRLFRKSIFGVADEVELKFMTRVKWSLHAREEIVFELLQHLRGNTTRSLLEGIRKSTREMIEEQQAVRGRLFTIQDVMQSTIRAWLQLCSLLGHWPTCFPRYHANCGWNALLWLKNPISEEQVEVKKLELQQLVKMFQHEAETHAQVSKPVSRHNLPPTAADKFLQEADYLLIH
ncbi:hypothetical protein ACH5RR_015473 [Cinchona calisaya]|uniref:Uncharacterized protein n=1 Tax=Cinchona calisaya TaxID=153742 RepID=A0ABD2ZT95_9GENT